MERLIGWPRLEAGVAPSVRWTIRLLAVVVAVSVTGGIAGSTVGGPLTDLGSGFGGLYALPAILVMAVAVFVALPASVFAARQARGSPAWQRVPVVVAGGAWMVALGYSFVAHVFDPCANGWWDLQSRIGEQPLCERFGDELNWHTRFHLLAHALPAALLLAVYLWAINRWATAPAGRDATKPSADRSYATVRRTRTSCR